MVVRQESRRFKVRFVPGSRVSLPLLLLLLLLLVVVLSLLSLVSLVSLLFAVKSFGKESVGFTLVWGIVAVGRLLVLILRLVARCLSLDVTRMVLLPVVLPVVSSWSS